MLDQEILAKLDQPLDPKRVKHRQGGGGMQLSYLKGHDAIDTANHIFGYGNWGYDLQGVELQNVYGENGEIIGGYYAARVKLTVVGCVPITEEGVCPIQEGRNPRAKIDAHDMARKGAITDAMKRALRCFGDQFGNSLYDSDLVDGQPRESARPTSAARPAPAAAVSPAPGSARPAQAVAAPAQAPAAASPVHPGLVIATEAQRQAILKMAARREISKAALETKLQELYGSGLDNLSKTDASHFIKIFQDQQQPATLTPQAPAASLQQPATASLPPEMQDRLFRAAWVEQATHIQTVTPSGKWMSITSEQFERAGKLISGGRDIIDIADAMGIDKFSLEAKRRYPDQLKNFEQQLSAGLHILAEWCESHPAETSTFPAGEGGASSDEDLFPDGDGDGRFYASAGASPHTSSTYGR